jgi:amidase
MGDIHALMGDGEVVICGAETSGEILLRAQPLRRMLPTPCVVTGEDIMFLASAKKLDQCEPMVLDKAHRFLTGVMKLKPNEAGRLMSLVGQLRVSQVVDPLKTMKFMLPLKVLKELGWQTRMKGLLRQKPNLVR